MKLDPETKRLLQPGQVAKEIKDLADNIALTRLLEKNEPAYVLVDAMTWLVPVGYPTDLATARADARRVRRGRWGQRVIVCRLEPVTVKSKRGKK